MWTYRRPYSRSQLTLASIDRHAKMGLYRALNVGRVIGFIGSGVSAGNGGPTWHALVDAAYVVVEALIKDFEVSFKTKVKEITELRGLEETLQEFRRNLQPGERRDSDELKVVLEVVDRLTRELDLAAQRRGVFDKDYNRRLRIGIAQFVEHRRPKTDGAEDNRTGEANEPGAEQKENSDLIRLIYDKLRIRRFLTVNYDGEIERFLDRRGFKAVPREHDGFGGIRPPNELPSAYPSEAMPSGDQRAACANGSNLSARDMMGRVVHSERLASTTVGNLIAFASLPHTHEAEVFHLHGRVDDPASFILTEADYQRTYLRRKETRGTFQESLETIFSGNEVLFIGVGMSEADLLRPLRQFLAEHRAPDTEARRFFALLPYPGPRVATARAIDLVVRYGVQTIFYGEATLKEREELERKIAQEGDSNSRSALQQKLSNNLAEALAAKLKGIETKQRQWWSEWNEGPEERWSRFDKHRMSAKTTGVSGSQAIPSAIEVTARHVTRYTSAARQSSVLTALKKFADEAFPAGSCSGRRILRVSGKRGMGRGSLVHELRVGGFRQVFPAMNDAAQPPADRQIYRAALFGHTSFSPEFGSVISGLVRFLARHTARPIDLFWAAKILAMEREQYASRCATQPTEIDEAIARLAEICQDLNLGTFDGSAASAEKLSNSFQHLPSTSAARYFTRFPRLLTIPTIAVKPVDAGRVSVAHGGTWRQSLWDADKRLNRLAQLRKVVRFLDVAGVQQTGVNESNESNRLFLCFMGLDRLCDRRGMAYNPTHREFFRILCDDRFKTAPLDILLIGSAHTPPIAYLSEQILKPVSETYQQREVSYRNLEADASTGLVGLQPILSPNRKDAVLANMVLDHADIAHDLRLELNWKAWPELPALPLEERHWLFHENSNVRLLGDAELLPNSKRQFAGALELRRLIREDVALDTWVTRCFAYLRTKRENDPNSCDFWLNGIEQAATRRDWREVLAVVLRTYWQFDRGRSKMGESEGSTLQGRSNGERVVNLHQAILRHLSLFSLPVQPIVLLTCPEVRKQLQDGKDVTDEAKFKELVRVLKDILVDERGLAIEIAPPQHEQTVANGSTTNAITSPTLSLDADVVDSQRRFTLHPRMREFLAQQMQFSLRDRGERNFFEVSLFAVQPRDLPTPAEAHFRLVESVVNELVQEARQILKLAFEAKEDSYVADQNSEHPNLTQANREAVERKALERLQRLPMTSRHAPAQLLRAAYSVLRESFSIGSLSRLSGFSSVEGEPEKPFEIYRGWLRGIINGATAISKTYEVFDKSSNEHLPHFTLRDAFYREEILWLYNERGLTAFTQGRLYDALPIFNAGLKRAKGFSTGGDNEFSYKTTEQRITLNVAVTQIERGNLREARILLGELVGVATHRPLDPPSTIQHLADGYQGLCDHLSGDMTNAARRYANVLKFAEDQNLLRIISIFERHAADLDRANGNLERAAQRIKRSVLSAAQDEQKDVLHFALVAQARILMRPGDRADVREALRLLDTAERYAQEMGLVKLEVVAISARAELILSQGETEFSGSLISRSIALANLHGMRLRKIAAVIVYGKILLERGQDELARTVLKQAGLEAERRGYQLKAELVDRIARKRFH